jgi:hypothetical protein
MSQSMVKRLVSKTDEMLSTPRSIKGSKKSTKAQLVSEEELPGITDAIKQGMSSTESQANPPMALLTTEIMLEKMILANSDNETDSKYLNALQLKILEANYEIAKINKEVETLFVRSLLNDTIDMKMVASIDALQADHKSLRLQAEELEKKAGEKYRNELADKAEAGRKKMAAKRVCKGVDEGKVQVEAIKQSLNERQVNEMKNYHPEVEFFNKDKLIELATNLIESNKNEASLYKQGNPALLGFFIGKMMKETLGAVGPKIVFHVMKHQLDCSIPVKEFVAEDLSVIEDQRSKLMDQTDTTIFEARLDDFDIQKIDE